MCQWNGAVAKVLAVYLNGLILKLLLKFSDQMPKQGKEAGDFI